MKYLFLCLAISLAGCTGSQNETAGQDKRFARDYKKVAEEIRSMMKADQDIRHFLMYGTTDNKWIDSLETAFENNGADIDSFIEKTNLPGLTETQKDSMYHEMAALGTLHTRRMIWLINQYGYPSPQRIDTTIMVAPDLLLEHGDWSFKDTVMKLLTRELQLKRMDSSSFEFIRWNMNGRKGVPAIPGVDILVKHEDGSVDTVQAAKD